MPRPSRSGTHGLYRDGESARWCIDLRWRDPLTGKARRHRERLPADVSAAAAKHRTRSILSAALAGTFDPTRHEPRSVSYALDEYATWSEVNRPRSAASRRTIAKTLRGAFGNVMLTDLNAFMVERFKRDRLIEGVGPATVNRALTVLKHMCSLAVTWNWMTLERSQEVRSVKLLKEPPGRVRYLRDDEQKRLFEVLPSGIRPIVSTALLTGMRLSEVVTLRKSAVDLAARLITLLHTKSNRVRRIPIPESLVPILDAAMRQSGTDFVFISRRHARYSRDAVTRMFHRAVLKANIADLRFHDLRHDYATRLRRGGVGLDAIAALLGHSSLAVTQRYAHIELSVLREAVAALANS